jgi:type I restriction enzyme, S subunit
MNSPWPKVKLGEVLTPVSRPEIVDPSKVYRILGAHWYATGLYTKDVKPGSGVQAKWLYRVEEGDFVYNRLFAWKGSFALATGDNAGCYVSNEFPCFVIRSDRVDGRYLWRYFSQASAWDEALGLSTGGTPTSRNRLKEDKLLEMEIPLPPLVEQRRIVARIEELAAKIDETRNMRQQAAGEAEGLISATISALSYSHRSNERTVADILGGSEQLKNGKSLKSFGDTSDFRCLTLSAVRNGRVSVTDSKPVPMMQDEAAPFLVKKGDVFVVRGNGSKDLCGRAGLVVEEQNSLIFPDLFIRVSLPPAEILPDFFVAVWNSAATRRVIEEKAKTTSGIWKINQGHILSTMIPVPPLSDQHRIVAELDALQAKVDALKRAQTETAAELDALLPSILDQAFRGEL